MSSHHWGDWALSDLVVGERWLFDGRAEMLPTVGWGDWVGRRGGSAMRPEIMALGLRRNPISDKDWRIPDTV
jgi:hypothetical protein